MSLSDFFVEPMLDDDKHLDEYFTQITELGKEGLLPNLDEPLTYKVYSISGGHFGAHKSIVLTTNDKHFITVELDFKTFAGKKHIYPRTRELPSSIKPHLTEIGEIKAKGLDLIVKAVAVMKRFGSYSKLSNNCQDFCNKYLAEIGLKGSLTDVDKAAIVTIVTGMMLSGGVIALGNMRQNTK